MEVPNPIDTHVGTKLRDTRSRLGLSAQTLATAIGVTSTRLLEFESGEARIEARVMAKICRVFDVRPSVFFTSMLSEADSRKSTRGKLDAA
ncbi:hypothetical protein CCR94_10480 [Rhodoblastus sphagnicola]|uniref:HTH cro/C1-type domain-containing protein n=1 Tax=Rhodoblastus sphagnicola TaxID=333368 RepID=A0A2S6N8X8_9HYPH|nr:hypothetical protein CCR94_10480 [Rhodoblastus sphagnicola]